MTIEFRSGDTSNSGEMGWNGGLVMAFFSVSLLLDVFCLHLSSGVRFLCGLRTEDLFRVGERGCR